ncbi:hypothetical protein [Larkinella soli]|uniref:hypothetical protein n=1 Tax=Larkinella soli TaxID=1770527 RepID=UPI000FFC9C67|nr:hypothetical protein [Larkinella soli]
MQIAKYLSVLLASTLKFIGGPLSGAALGLNWVETWLCTVLGMMLSVITVTYAGTAFRAVVGRFRKSKPRRFTRRTRLAVKVWKRAGIFGIALLTPLILTPIGGTILALSFKVHRPQIFVYMLLSALSWGIVFTLLVYQIPGVFK